MRNPQREASRWLRQAEVDVDAARANAERFPALSCFLAQHSAEKALKAILYATGERLVVGHSIGDLGRRVAEHSPSYAALSGDAAALDRFYVPTRYPNGLPEGAHPSEAFNLKDARAAAEVAAKVLEHARTFVGRGLASD